MSDDVSIENMVTDYDIPIAKCLNGIANSIEDNERLEYGKLFIRLLNRPLECILSDIQHFSSTLVLIGNDKNECVRTNLIQQIPYIFVRCYELQCTELENNLYDILLDIVLMYLQDAKIQVRKYALSSITLLLEKYLIDDMRIKYKLCTAIAKLSKVILCDIEQIDIHINAITLMAQLATTIGKENTEEYFLPCFLEMCDNSIYFVRRTCAQNFPIFCQVMGNEKTEMELLPTYLKLCEDHIWSVRLAATESLPIINLMCSDKCKWESLTPLMLSFLNDSSRWVCRMAFKVLGQFIAAFAKPCITNVAYSRPGNIFITNAANDNFKFESENDDTEENTEENDENEKVENVINSTLTSAATATPITPSSFYYLSPLSLSLSMSTTSTVWTNSNVQLDDSSKIYDNNLINKDKVNASRTTLANKNPYAKFLRELWAIDDISNGFESFDKYKLYFSSTSGNRNFNLYNYHNNLNINSSSSSSNIGGGGGGNNNNEYGTFEDDYDNNNITGKLVDIYDNTSSSVKDNVITTPKSITLDNENNNNNNTTFNNNTNINSDNNNNNFTINKNKKNKKKKIKLDKNNNNKNLNIIINESDNIIDSTNDINANKINSMDTTETTDVIEQNINVDGSSGTVDAATVAVETGNIDVSLSSDSNDNQNVVSPIAISSTITTTTITQPISSSPINIVNSSRGDNLHKNVPIELPSIIKKAIDNKKLQSKFKNNSRLPNSLDFNAILQKQSIETPLIENAPQNLDWSNLTTSTTLNTNIVNDQPLFYDATVTVQATTSSELPTTTTTTAESSVTTEPLAVPLAEAFEAITLDQSGATITITTTTTSSPIQTTIINDPSGGSNLVEKSNSNFIDDNNGLALHLDSTTTTTTTTITSRQTIKDILKDFCKDDYFDFSIENEKEHNEKMSNINNNNNSNGIIVGSSSSSGSSQSSNSSDDFNDEIDIDIYNAYQFWHVDPTVDVDMEIMESRSSYNEGVYKMSDACSISFDNKHALEEKNEDVSISLSMLLKELTTNVGLRNFEQNIVPASLIQCFASMIHYDDPEVNFYCAYNFPAIVFTLGKRNWHLLFKLLRRLCSDIQWKIRKTLASSIYHVALIVGKRIASRDLVPIFVGFLKDLDEIKIEAIRNLKNFLGIIDLNEHFDIIKMLGGCLYTDSVTNWRLREDLAQQLYLLLKDYDLSKTDCIVYITGICLLLLTDKVSTVREIALNAITIKLNRGTDVDVIELLILEFCRNKHWRRRQTFALICEKLIGENVVEPITYQNMLENLIQLASDTVPNVRLNVAKCLTHDMTVYSSSTYSKLILTLQQLQNDKDRDVQETLHCYFPKITLIRGDDDDDDDDDNDDNSNTKNSTDADDANNIDKKSIQVKTTYEN